MERKEIEELAKEQNKTFLKISRVPTHIKELFTEIAEGEYCGDYGLFLRDILLGYLEYQRVKEVLLDKEFISLLLGSNNEKEEEVTEEPKGKKTFGDVMEKRREEVKGGNDKNE